jgi:hypothetical protein
MQKNTNVRRTMKRESLLESDEMTTMVDCINSLTRKGFTESYTAKEEGLQSLSTKRLYKPEDVKILDFYRFEGMSDPADNSILYALETSDGKRGTLLDAYGPYADTNVGKFFIEVENISKRIDDETLLI